MSEMHSEDADVPALAVEALRAANRVTIQSGATIVLVRDGKLIRIEPNGETVLKTVGELPKVSGSRKRIRRTSRPA